MRKTSFVPPDIEYLNEIYLGLHKYIENVVINMRSNIHIIINCLNYTIVMVLRTEDIHILNKNMNITKMRQHIQYYSKTIFHVVCFGSACSSHHSCVTFIAHLLCP